MGRWAFRTDYLISMTLGPVVARMEERGERAHRIFPSPRIDSDNGKQVIARRFRNRIPPRRPNFSCRRRRWKMRTLGRLWMLGRHACGSARGLCAALRLKRKAVKTQR